jgi:release factor glutamine methyltransferase
MAQAATIEQALARAGTHLAGEGARADAEFLLAHLLGIGRGQLYARLRERLTEPDVRAYELLVQRRRRGEPVAYITGEQGFWSLRLAVTPAVLVPRPETELLVEWALQQLARRTSPQVADLGTGSGCIALALAAERPDAEVLATDASDAALAVARGNAAQLGLQRVRFENADFADDLAARCGRRFDLIVSNPPYIAAGDGHLAELRHEPLTALSDGADGLNCLRTIIASAPTQLTPGGMLLVEHGYDQGAAVRALFAAAGLGSIETRRDLGGQERATAGCRS